MLAKAEHAKQKQNNFLKLIQRLSSNDPTLTYMEVEVVTWWNEPYGHPSGHEATTTALLGALKKNHTLVVLNVAECWSADDHTRSTKKGFKAFLLGLTQLLKNNHPLPALFFNGFDLFDDEGAQEFASAMEVNKTLLFLQVRTGYVPNTTSFARFAVSLAKALIKNKTLLGLNITQDISFNTKGFWGDDSLDKSVYNAFEETLEHNRSLIFLNVFGRESLYLKEHLKEHRLSRLIIKNNTFTKNISLMLELLTAVEFGNLDKVIELYEKGIPVCSAVYSQPIASRANASYGGYTPLMLAVLPRNFRYVYMVKSKTDILDDKSFICGGKKFYFDYSEIVLFWDNEFLTAYWIEDSSIVSRSLPEKDVLDIISELPKDQLYISWISAKPLRDKIILKFPVTNLKMVEWLLKQDTFPNAIAPDPSIHGSIAKYDLSDFPYELRQEFFDKERHTHTFSNFVGKSIFCSDSYYQTYQHVIHPSHAGKTALQIAEQYGFTEVASAIKQAIKRGPLVPDQKAAASRIQDEDVTASAIIIGAEPIKDKSLAKTGASLDSKQSVSDENKKDSFFSPSERKQNKPKELGATSKEQQSSSAAIERPKSSQIPVVEQQVSISSSRVEHPGIEEKKFVKESQVSVSTNTPLSTARQEHSAPKLSEGSNQLNTVKEQKEHDNTYEITADEKRTLKELQRHKNSILSAPMLLRELNEHLDKDPVSQMERTYISTSPHQLERFNRRLHQDLNRTLTAAIIISSGEVQVTGNKKKHLIDLAEAVTSNLWGVNILCSIFFKMMAFANEADKKKELMRIANLFVSIEEAEKLVSRTVRQITIAYEPIILGRKPRFDSTATGALKKFFDDVEQWAEEFYKTHACGEKLNKTELLAIQVGALIIKGMKENQYGLTKDRPLLPQLVCIAMQDSHYTYIGLTQMQIAMLDSGVDLHPHEQQQQRATFAQESKSVSSAILTNPTSSSESFFVQKAQKAEAKNEKQETEEQLTVERIQKLEADLRNKDQAIQELRGTIGNLSKTVESLGGNPSSGGGQVQMFAPRLSPEESAARSELTYQLLAQLKDLTASVTLITTQTEEIRTDLGQLRADQNKKKPESACSLM